MKNYTTIKTFTYSHEAHILKATLTSEGIKCYLTNEHTVQTNPLSSNAVGGVELKVLNAHFEKATAILKENGSLNDEDDFSIVNSITKVTSKIPLLNLLPPVISALLVISLFVTLLIVYFAFIKGNR